MEITDVKVEADMQFGGAQIAHLNISHTRLRNLTAFSSKGTRFQRLSLTNTDVSSDIHLEATQIGEDLNIESSTIKSFLYSSGTTETVSERQSFSSLQTHEDKPRRNILLENSTFAGDINFKDIFLDGRLSIMRSKAESIIISFEHPPPAKIHTILLSGNKINGGVHAADTCVGQVLVCGGEIKGDVDFDRHKNDSSAIGYLSIQDIAICGNFTLQGVKIEQGAAIIRSSIGGNFEVDKSQIGSCEIYKNFILVDTSIKGDFECESVDVMGDFRVESTTFRNFNRFKIRDRKVSIRGICLLARVISSGEMNLGGIMFESPIRFESCELGIIRSGEVGGDSTSTLVFDSCKLNHLKLGGDSIYSLDLQFSHCKLLEISGLVPYKILNEFTFNNIHVSGGVFKFLERIEPPNPGIYYAVENWSRSRGLDDQATAVFLALRKRLRSERRRRVGWINDHTRQLWDVIVDMAMWLGLESHRIAAYFLFMIVFSTIVFLQPGALVPKEQEKSIAVANPSPVAKISVWLRETLICVEGFPLKDFLCEKGRVVRPIDGFWMAVQFNVPLVTVPAAERWQASDKRIGRFFLSYADFASGLRILGWIALPIFVASVTGILKRAHQRVGSS